MNYQYFFKPLLDKTIALLVLILLSPILFVVIILLSIYNQGKPFFFQFRPGLHGKIFRIVKFKTMNDLRNPQGELLSDAQRLTPIGRFVRKTSLDELPQLLNVLRGEMSLIGPRPLLTEYLPLYSKQQQKRHDVKPGITGWAQVNGRNAISWAQKFEYDIWYVEHLSFQLDIKILWLTIINVFSAKDINAANSATVDKFTGNN